MNQILLLEDEESLNRGISFSLEKAGFSVSSCYTIKEAKKKIQEITPKIIICDINLPDGNGLEFIAFSRKNYSAYIICLTALNQEIDQVMGYEAGADDYITKPFSLSVLLLKIEAYFKRTEAKGRTQFIQSGNLKFYPTEMKLFVNKEEISLTKNEWKLLDLFMRNAKQVLSKRQILEGVFDMDGDFVDENTLAVNIRRLREKIEKNPSNPEFIKNIRGLGYLWNEDCNENYEA